MTTVGDLRAIDDLLNLLGVERTALRLVYAADYYDGPLSGLLQYQDTPCWFEAYDPHPSDDVDRIYMIIALSPEQREQEEHWHALFQEKVGRHWDFDYEVPGSSLAGITGIAPPETHHEFYEQYKARPPRDLSPNHVLGWFIM